MAAINKLRTNSYEDYNKLRIWCIGNEPSLLNSFFNPCLSYSKWEQLQQNIRNKYSHIEDDYYDKKLAIAHFSSNDNKYLYWHCPLEFVREYLETQCNFKKANWFVKLLFWKY